MASDERLLEGHDLVRASIRGERRLDVAEYNERTVGTTAMMEELSIMPSLHDRIGLPKGSVGLGDANGVVEREPESFVCVVATLILK